MNLDPVKTTVTLHSEEQQATLTVNTLAEAVEMTRKYGHNNIVHVYQKLPTGETLVLRGDINKELYVFMINPPKS